MILLGSTFMVYLMAAFAGDPLEEARLIQNEEERAAKIQMLTRALNLDVPAPIRYLMWLRGVGGLFIGKLDLGGSGEGEPVVDSLGLAIPTTLRLVFAATILAIVVGITVGIITALRQYSAFDYTMTFVSFLFFSLPVFWVAVLLKEFGAIGLNDFMWAVGNEDALIGWEWIVVLSLASGALFAGIISGDRAKSLRVFLLSGGATAAVLLYMSFTHWFATPAIGPVVFAALSVGVAFMFTVISTGLSNRKALYASLTMAGLGIALYYPMNLWVFGEGFGLRWLLLLAVVTVLVGVLTGFLFTKIDRGPVMRTSALTAFSVAGLIVLDKILRSVPDYSSTDAVNGRPIATFSQENSLLEFTDWTMYPETSKFWFITVDVITHLMLPTLALLIISFATYVRYARLSVLEVLNQDYIRTARAKGLTERTVIMRHAFRNALVPLATIVIFDIGGVLGGAIITENIFGWRGMGTLLNRAIGTYDLNLLMGVSLVTVSIYLVLTIIIEFVYAALDPRIRIED